jgi:hypothetical protein
MVTVTYTVINLTWILNRGGPRPSFTDVSICVPIDVNANRQLYCLIFFINLFDDLFVVKRTKDASGSGRGLYGGM